MVDQSGWSIRAESDFLGVGEGGVTVGGEEGDDFVMESVTRMIPMGDTTEKFNTIPGIGEPEFFDAVLAEVFDFRVDLIKKGKFKAIASLTCSAFQRNGNGGGE